MAQIKFDPEVLAECKRMDKEGMRLQRVAFRYILIAFAIYFVALGLTVAELIPNWLMYIITAGTIATIWYSNRLTTRAHRMMRNSFRLIDAEMMRLLRGLK